MPASICVKTKDGIPQTFALFYIILSSVSFLFILIFSINLFIGDSGCGSVGRSVVLCLDVLMLKVTRYT